MLNIEYIQRMHLIHSFETAAMISDTRRFLDQCIYTAFEFELLFLYIGRRINGLA